MRLCCIIPARDEGLAPPLPASEHPHRVRHSQSGHLVEHGVFDGGLDLLIVKAPRPELASEHRLESEHRIFSQTLPGATARGSPTISALRVNRAQGRVARHAPHRWIGSYTCSRIPPRHDGCDSTAGQYRLVCCTRIVAPVAGDLGYGAGDLREQGRQPPAVMNAARGDIGGKDLFGRFVNAQVQLPPGPSACTPVFPPMPLASAIDLQACRIHDDVPSARTICRWQAHRQPCLPAAHGAVIWYGEFEPHQRHDGLQESLCGPKAEVKD